MVGENPVETNPGPLVSSFSMAVAICVVLALLAYIISVVVPLPGDPGPRNPVPTTTQPQDLQAQTVTMVPPGGMPVWAGR